MGISVSVLQTQCRGMRKLQPLAIANAVEEKEPLPGQEWSLHKKKVTQSHKKRVNARDLDSDKEDNERQPAPST